MGWHFGLTWTDYKAFPLSYRRWLVERVNKEMSSNEKNNQIPSKAETYNHPDVRQLSGRQRAQTPVKARRFK